MLIFWTVLFCISSCTEGGDSNKPNLQSDSSTNQSLSENQGEDPPRIVSNYTPCIDECRKSFLEFKKDPLGDILTKDSRIDFISYTPNKDSIHKANHFGIDIISDNYTEISTKFLQIPHHAIGLIEHDGTLNKVVGIMEVIFKNLERENRPIECVLESEGDNIHNDKSGKFFSINKVKEERETGIAIYFPQFDHQPGGFENFDENMQNFLLKNRILTHTKIHGVDDPRIPK